MTLPIKLILLQVFLSVALPLSLMAEETASENLPEPETEAVSKSNVEVPAEAPRTVQIPIFKNGKWEGYREEPMEPERKPTSAVSEETSDTVSPAPEETGKPDSLIPSP